MFRTLIMIGAGGFLGSVSRYLASRFIQQSFLSSFPYGTFLVNVVGCLLIGFLYGLIEKGHMLSTEWRMFLIVGFCGGFTTFSTFTYENLNLLRDKAFAIFSLYTGFSIFAGLIATVLGIMAAKAL